MALQSLRPDVPGQIVRGAQLNRQLGQREIEHNALVAQREITNQRADRTLDQSGRRLDYNIGRQDSQDQIAAQKRKLEMAAYSQNWIADRVRGMDALEGNLPEQYKYADQAFKQAAELDIDVGDWTPRRFLDPNQRKALLAQTQSEQARLKQLERENAATVRTKDRTNALADQRFKEPLKKVPDSNDPTKYTWQRQSDAAGEPAPAPAPSSEVTVITGDQPSKTTLPKIEAEVMKGAARLQRLAAIQESFKPEFLEFGTRFDAMVLKIKDKAGIKLAPGDKKLLQEFSVFRRRTYDDLNNTVRDMSGAAVTPQESIRLLKAIPDPGEGLFDGDSPIVFKVKLDDVIKQLNLAQARLHYYRSKGFKIESLEQLGRTSLGEMEKIIGERGQAVWKEVQEQYPTWSPEMVEAEASARTAIEFGLDYRK